MTPCSGSRARTRQQRSPRSEQRAERKKAEIPAERTAEVVTNVMNPKQLVVDQALHQVEDAPAGEQKADVHAPWRGELSSLPRAHEHDGGDCDEQPSGQVEEAV